MGNLEDLVQKEVAKFTSRVKDLVSDHMAHAADDPSPQTIEENYPSHVKHEEEDAVPVVTSEVEVNDIHDMKEPEEEVKTSPSPAFATPPVEVTPSA